MRTARHAGPAIDSAAVIPSTIDHHHECRQIQRPHSEQHLLDEAAEHGRQHEADHGPRCDDASRVGNHEAEHVVGRRTQRPAHAEVTHVLLDRIGEDSEDADHRKHERECGKGDHHHGAEAMTAGGRPGDVFERHDAPHADELLLVHTREGRADSRSKRLRPSGLRPHDDEDVVGKILRHRHVELNEVPGLVGAALHLPRDTNDLAHDRFRLRRRDGPQRHSLADRRSAVKVAREGLVDDTDGNTVAPYRAGRRRVPPGWAIRASRSTPGSPPDIRCWAAGFRLPAVRRRSRTRIRQNRKNQAAKRSPRRLPDTPGTAVTSAST